MLNIFKTNETLQRAITSLILTINRLHLRHRFVLLSTHSLLIESRAIEFLLISLPTPSDMLSFSAGPTIKVDACNPKPSECFKPSSPPPPRQTCNTSAIKPSSHHLDQARRRSTNAAVCNSTVMNVLRENPSGSSLSSCFASHNSPR